MTVTLPLSIALGDAYTGMALGFGVLNIDRSPYASWVALTESPTVPGTYVAVGGFPAPEAGGYIVFGLVAQDMYEFAFEPTVAGPSGAPGVQGPQGPMGVQGTQGPAGMMGAQGSSVQGPQGSQGTQGAYGAAGMMGYQGSTGVTGAQGPQGPMGYQGVPGGS